MNDDELRQRLRRIDPVADDAPVEHPTTPSSRQRLERIMETTTIGTEQSDPDPKTGRGRWLVAVAACALVVIGVSVVAFGGSDDDSSAPPLELALGESDVMASCLAPSADILADVPVAFAATATASDGETVTLEVDRWYTGGDAETVQLQAPSGMEALIDGFAFEVGEQYLVSATDGTVNFCGMSGAASPELQAMYDDAFPG